MILLDSNVFIDVIRRYPLAVAWMENHYPQVMITPIVWMELLQGAGNKRAQQTLIDLLRPLRTEYLTPDDFELALRLQIRFSLSHGAEMNDCMIAAVALRLSIPLVTHNLKHLRPMLGELAQPPAYPS